MKGLKIADPDGLLQWLAKELRVVTLKDAKDVEAQKAALRAIVQAWIRQI